jgi:hypothetical protein
MSRRGSLEHRGGDAAALEEPSETWELAGDTPAAGPTVDHECDIHARHDTKPNVGTLHELMAIVSSTQERTPPTASTITGMTA